MIGYWFDLEREREKVKEKERVENKIERMSSREGGEREKFIKRKLSYNIGSLSVGDLV